MHLDPGGEQSLSVKWTTTGSYLLSKTELSGGTAHGQLERLYRATKYDTGLAKLWLAIYLEGMQGVSGFCGS
jgi:hypothetical protein